MILLDFSGPTNIEVSRFPSFRLVTLGSDTPEDAYVERFDRDPNHPTGWTPGVRLTPPVRTETRAFGKRSWTEEYDITPDAMYHIRQTRYGEPYQWQVRIEDAVIPDRCHRVHVLTLSTLPWAVEDAESVFPPHRTKLDGHSFVVTVPLGPLM